EADARLTRLSLSHGINLSIGCYCENESRCHRSLVRERLTVPGANLGQSPSQRPRLWPLTVRIPYPMSAAAEPIWRLCSTPKQKGISHERSSTDHVSAPEGREGI